MRTTVVPPTSKHQRSPSDGTGSIRHAPSTNNNTTTTAMCQRQDSQNSLSDVLPGSSSSGLFGFRWARKQSVVCVELRECIVVVLILTHDYATTSAPKKLLDPCAVYRHFPLLNTQHLGRIWSLDPLQWAHLSTIQVRKDTPFIMIVIVVEVIMATIVIRCSWSNATWCFLFFNRFMHCAWRMSAGSGYHQRPPYYYNNNNNHDDGRRNT